MQKAILSECSWKKLEAKFCQQIKTNLYACVASSVSFAFTWPAIMLIYIGLSKQLAKINNSSLTTTHSARNFGFIFDEHSSFSDQISSVSKSCYYHICQLRCIRPYLDTKTASTTATSIVHSKLDYYNSLYHNLPKSQITRLQQIQNSRTCCCQSSQIQSHHSHPPVSTLAKDNWARWIQAPLTYLQSSDNHPTFISA